MLAPVGKTSRQLAGVPGKHPIGRITQAEQILRLRIVLLDHSLTAQHQNAILHFFDDALTDENLIMQLDPPLTGELLVRDDTPCQQPGRDRHAEKAGAKQTCLEKINDLDIGVSGPIGLL